MVPDSASAAASAASPASAPAPQNAPAIVLAAGRGERMRPLTDTTPKPMLAVQGKPLLQWHLEALARGGVPLVCINTAWLGELVPKHFGASITPAPGPAPARQPGTSPTAPLPLLYSMEGLDFGDALETAGGVARALRLLPDGKGALADVFWLAAGDVYVPGFEFSPESAARFAASTALAHLWLVPNPPHNPRGDFGLAPDGRALNLPPDHPGPRYTYSTIGLFRRALFQPPWCHIPPGNPHGVKAPLAPLLRHAMDNGHITAELYHGPWTDVGTPERLQELNRPQ